VEGLGDALPRGSRRSSGRARGSDHGADPRPLDGGGPPGPPGSSPPCHPPSCDHCWGSSASGEGARSPALSRSSRSRAALWASYRSARLSGGGGWEALRVDPPRVRQTAPRHQSPAASLAPRSSKTTHAEVPAAYCRYASSPFVLSVPRFEVGANGRLTVTPRGDDMTASDI